MSRHSLRLWSVLVLGLGLGCQARGPGRAAQPGDRDVPQDVQTLAVFDPAGVGRGTPPPKVETRPLAVQEYGPIGRTEGRGEIHIRFNQPVVALALVEPTASAELTRHFTIDPPLPGEARWKTPDLLVYTPTETPAPATRYQLRFAGAVVGLDGQRYDQPLEWAFETPRPQVTGSDPESLPLQANLDEDDEDDEDDAMDNTEVQRRDLVVLVEFDAPVTPAQAKAHIQATARSLDPAKAASPAQPVPVRVRVATAAERERMYSYSRSDDHRKLYAVAPAGLWPGNSEIDVAVTPGLQSTAGPLGLDTPWSMRFRTYGPQVLVSHGCDADPCGLEPVELRLRNPVTERQLAKIKVSPRPRYLEIDGWDDWGEGARTVKIEGMWLPGTTYTIHIPGDMRDRYGQVIAGGKSVKVLIAPRADLALSAGHGTLAPDLTRTIGVESRYVRSITVRAGVFEDSDLAKLPANKSARNLGFPGKVITRSYDLTPSGKTEWSSVALDLVALAGNRRRPVLVEVTADAVSDRATAYGVPQPVRGLFDITDLGPLVTASLPSSSVQVLRLSDQTPVAGAEIFGLPRSTARRRLGVTDAAGLLALPAEMIATDPKAAMALIVRDPSRDDVTTLALHETASTPRVRNARTNVDADPRFLRPGERLIARMVSERGVYRPGEKVRVVGWSVLDTPFSRSNLGNLPAKTEARFALEDSRRQVVAEHAMTVTKDGKFWAELEIPAGASLGRYTVKAHVLGKDVTTGVKVEDYRVPEFSVAAKTRDPDIIAGSATKVDVHASYYFGGPVPFDRMSEHGRCYSRFFRPAGIDGQWEVGEPLSHQRSSNQGLETKVIAGVATKPGHRTIDLTYTGSPRYPQHCTVSVQVQDKSMQGIGAEATVMVHPASFYLGVAPPRGVHYALARDLEVPLRAFDPQGRRVAAGPVELKVVRHWSEPTYKPEGGRQVFNGWADRSEPIKTCTLSLPASGPDPTCKLPALAGGRYELSASATEPGSTREAHTQASFRVSPKSPLAVPQTPREPAKKLEVQPERRHVQPGETLEVVVRAPWNDARGNLVLARGGIRDVHPLQLQDGEARLTFEVDDTWTPEVNFQATVVHPLGATPSPPRVERASNVVYQSSDHRHLGVRVDAPGRAGPGDTVALRVTVRDHQDQPSAARVALWAVDEAVLDLTDYKVPELLPDFIPNRRAELSMFDGYAAVLRPYYVRAVDPWFDEISYLRSSGGSGFGRGYGGGYGASRQAQATVVQPARSRFETTPVFLADVTVGKSGSAEVKAKLPDNLTTFRVTAVASARLVDGSATGRFGMNDARMVVSAPLILRPVLPRHLRPGDTAELAAIVQNNTGTAGRVEVSARIVDPAKTPALRLDAPTKSGVTIDEGDQVRLGFQVHAVAAGTAEVEMHAVFRPANGGEVLRDGVRLPVPVAAEQTLTERVAIYGTVTDDQAVAVPVKLPTQVLPSHGGVTVSTTSTLLGGLEDAVHSLINYPYGCVEQTSSRLLPIVALGQLAPDYPLGVTDVSKFMQAGVERILSMQTPSGGFGYWPGDSHVHVYASAYATWVLQRAVAAGHPVPAAALERALDDLDRRISKLDITKLPVGWGYDEGVRVAIALHVLGDAGRPVADPAKLLYTQRQQLPLFARAFLLMALHRGDPKAAEVATLRDELLGNLQETQATAHTQEQRRYSLSEYFDSDGRSDAIVLMALLRVAPEHPVLVKLARGLTERRIGGVWRNTQENAYALVALAEYAKVYEAEVPDFTARAWVGATQVLGQKFAGREMATQTVTTDMATILGMQPAAEATLLPVVLAREGQGRLYYRIGAEWAPAAQAALPAQAQGLTVTRNLRSKAGDVRAAVTAGESLAIDVTVHNDIRLRYVVVNVPLPAGLEGVSRTLGKGRAAAVLGGHHGWWVSYEEQRADRVVVFADDLPPGVHHHTIDLRATGRGKFAFPPTTAEAMYMPEVYGRTTGAELTVQ